MTRNKNNRYVAALWVLPVVLAVVVGGSLVATVATSRDGTAIVPVVGAVVGLLAVLGFSLGARRRVERAFLQRGPDALLRALRPAQSSMIPDAAAWGAYFEAWSLTLYGEFERARAALDRVEWSRRPQVVRAAAMSVEVLLCFFDTRDFTQGFNLARSARATADISANFPGAKAALNSYDSLVEIGRALTDSPRPDTLENLAAHARNLPFGARLIAMWGLAAAYDRAGDPTSADDTIARCRELAPHCAPLRSLPRPASVGSAS
ncbi:MAG: hypothetical protein ABJE95_28430 [Byssovorax sp.]